MQIAEQHAAYKPNKPSAHESPSNSTGGKLQFWTFPTDIAVPRVKNDLVWVLLARPAAHKRVLKEILLAFALEVHGCDVAALCDLLDVAVDRID
jgi:hypothetical protein